MNADRTRVKAFTIVELLVVIGILALLIGILLPALSGAQRRSLKQNELNALRQIGYAWTLYANSSNDKILPGFIGTAVQKKWRVGYLYPSRIPIQPSPSFTSSDPEIANPWPWRLLPFLEHSLETVYGYIEDPHTANGDPIFDIVTLDPLQITAQLDMQIIAEAAFPIAYEPSFGYNAVYVGGWWEMQGAGSDNAIPRYRFYDARGDRNGDGNIDANERVNVVSRSAGTIRRASQLVTFCSSAVLQPGVYRKFDNLQPGSPYVVPPQLGNQAKWRLAGQTTSAAIGNDTNPDAAADPSGGLDGTTTGGLDPDSIAVEMLTSPPIGRYTRQAATLYADGHTAVNSPVALLDMRVWIDAASTVGFTHDAGSGDWSGP